MLMLADILSPSCTFWMPTTYASVHVSTSAWQPFCYWSVAAHSTEDCNVISYWELRANTAKVSLKTLSWPRCTVQSWHSKEATSRNWNHPHTMCVLLLRYGYMIGLTWTAFDTESNSDNDSSVDDVFISLVRLSCIIIIIQCTEYHGVTCPES